MTYPIEEQKPTPRVGTLSATLKTLSVGQSFLIPFNDIKEVKKTQAAVHTLAKQFEMKCATRSEGEGLRVYRIENVEREKPDLLEAVKVFQEHNKKDWEGVDVDAYLRKVREKDVDDRAEVPITHNEKLDGLRDLIGLASSGVKASEIYGDEREPYWRFTQDKPQYDDSGDVYRKQLLYPDGKAVRTVQVDADNLEEIIKIK